MSTLALACQDSGSSSARPGSGSVTAELGDGMDPNAPGALALRGCFQADYSAVGTVGKTQSLSLLVDSGSKSLAIASTLCDDCDELAPLYDPSGANAKDLNRAVNAMYGDADASTQTGWDGKAYSDQVQLGTTGATQMALGAIIHQSLDSQNQPSMFIPSSCTGTLQASPQEGIIGLAPANLGPTQVDSYLNSWAASTRNPNLFAVQLCDLDGRLWMGTFDANFTTAAPQYTPMQWNKAPNPGYYLVSLSGISIGDTNLSIAANNMANVLADTGTSIMTVTSATLSQLSRVLEANATYVGLFDRDFMGSGTCVLIKDVSRAQLDAALPPMTLTFPGTTAGTLVQMRLPATSSYLMPAVHTTGEIIYCAAVESGTLAGVQNINMILGNSLMHQHVMIFDADNQRLGFAPQTRCTETFE